MKIKSLCCAGLITLTLTACHENPLANHSQRKSVDFLLKASNFAEKHIDTSKSKHSGPYIYQSCLEEGYTEGVDCHQFYEAMLAYAKNTDFKDITRSDLTDKKAHKRLAEAFDFSVSIYEST